MIIALAWLWQGLVLAGLAFVLLRALPNVNAATRHAMWWAALLAVLCIPLVLSARGVQDVLPGVPAAPVTDARVWAPLGRVASLGTSCGGLCARVWPARHRGWSHSGRAAGRCGARSGDHARA